jgi:hypothetical protein
MTQMRPARKHTPTLVRSATRSARALYRPSTCMAQTSDQKRFLSSNRETRPAISWKDPESREPNIRPGAGDSRPIHVDVQPPTIVPYDLDLLLIKDKHGPFHSPLLRWHRRAPAGYPRPSRFRQCSEVNHRQAPAYVAPIVAATRDVGFGQHAPRAPGRTPARSMISDRPGTH